MSSQQAASCGCDRFFPLRNGYTKEPGSDMVCRSDGCRAFDARSETKKIQVESESDVVQVRLE